MNPATINQSSRLITDAIYAKEHFENQDQKEREAITMDEFHRGEILRQFEENANRTKELEKLVLASKEEEELQKNKASERNKYYKDLEEKYQWTPLKSHWYWSEYLNNTPPPNDKNVPAYLDNLNSDNTVKIELSSDYKHINSGANVKVLEGAQIGTGCVYRAPFREYCYDHTNDKLIPNDKRYITDNNILNLEQKCLSNNGESEAFDQKFKEKIESKEGFENENLLDSKLMSIYTKTLYPQEDLEPGFISNFTYWHCLILVIIFFLLFRGN
jgi:hypothetical protein